MIALVMHRLACPWCLQITMFVLRIMGLSYLRQVMHCAYTLLYIMGTFDKVIGWWGARQFGDVV